MRYHLLTLGCPKNVADSGRLERLLQEAGHLPATAAKAEMLIVNTCGFIDQAKEESINAILKLAAQKRPRTELVVVGCLPQLYRKELLDEMPEIDHIFGVEAWERIAALAGEAKREEADADSPRPPLPRVSAYLKIADGCNARCSLLRHPPDQGPPAQRRPSTCSWRRRSASPTKGRASWCSSRRTAPPTAATWGCATASPQLLRATGVAGAGGRVAARHVRLSGACQQGAGGDDGEPAAGVPLPGHCRSSTAVLPSSSGCAALTMTPSCGARWSVCGRRCRTSRCARPSSSASRARRRRSFRGCWPSSARRGSTTWAPSRSRPSRARRRRECRVRCRSASSGVATANSCRWRRRRRWRATAAGSDGR